VVLEVNSKDLVQDGHTLHIAALRDVTEKRQRELELQHLQIRFARMVDSNMVGVYVARPDGAILESNGYFLNLIGRSRADLDNGLLSWKDLTPRESMEVSLRGRDELLRTGVCRPYEKEYWRPGGSTVQVLVALARLPGQDYQILAIVVDISKLKAAQAQLKDANVELLQRTLEAERAEAAKTLFLSSVSHELRTPLHTMLGHLRLMRKRAQGEDLRQLTVVERSSSHLLRLIEDLLEYNHAKISPERLEPERVVLQGFLDSMQMIGNAAMAESDNQFVIQLGDDLPTTLVVDEGRLTQVLRILIDNARKYTRAGVVLFSLSLESDRRTADGSAHCGLRFSVEDNGRGIDAADVAHIFEPLNRGSLAPELHGKGHGLGLGLAIAAQWIERMGSTITVQTMRGVGSAFSFVLDLAVGFETVAPAQASLHSPHFSLQTPLLKLNMHALSANELNSLGELIHMGRLGRLRNWAHALEMRYPQQQEAAALVAELAANADLDALEALHLRWAALGQQEESNNRPRED
jgi:PAS domain S-box-containing protein